MTIRRHHIEPRRVFFDLETSGKNPQAHTIIEIGMLAYDHSWNERGRWRARIAFNEADADPQALEKNHYDRALWERTALQPRDAFNQLAYFLREHATVERTSARTGKKYFNAQLFAHNAAFDADFLWTWHRKLRDKHGPSLYLPAERNIICTYQAALNLWHQNPQLPRPVNFKLGTLCEYTGVPFSVNESHTALYDAHKAAQLYRVMEEFEYGEDDVEELHVKAA